MTIAFGNVNDLRLDIVRLAYDRRVVRRSPMPTPSAALFRMDFIVALFMPLDRHLGFEE
jgi:hypothetical protein